MTRKEPSLGDLNELLAPQRGQVSSTRRAPSPPPGPTVTPQPEISEGAVVAAVAPATPKETPKTTKEHNPATTPVHPTLFGTRGRLRRIRFMNRLAFVTLTVLLCVYPAYEWIVQPRDPIFFARGAGFVVLALTSIWMSISAIVRRMHDVGRSAWWLLSLLVPGVNVITLLVLFAWPGKSDENRFGPPNRYSTLLTWLLFLLLIIIPLGITPAGTILYDAHVQSLAQ